MVGQITYEWFINETEKNLSEENISYLRSQAIERAKELIEQGNREGELSGCITQDNEEIELRGWWKHLTH